jgi:L-2-hydroxyglutarate oxidase
MVDFCAEHGVAHEVCGKVVVAVSDDEIPRLTELHHRCAANGVDVELIGPERLAELEPHASGVQALHVKVTGIADYPGACRVLAEMFVDAGGELHLSTAVTGAATDGDQLVLETTAGPVRTARAVNCAGLHADRIARLLGGEEAARGMVIVPFRGEYFELAPSRSYLVRSLIYPVPDPQFPFLGVHLTRGVNGRIHAGPNAVLALAREGYSWRIVDRRDVAETLRFSGFRALAKAQWRYGLSEMVRSVSRARFAASLSRLVPGIEPHDLEPASSGVRAQALHPDGRLADDFEFGRSNDGRVLHVLNAPSPAATASLVIGEQIAGELLAGV